ncbi:hypothetical protein BSKO_00146 [Bryopsis sp. KO-2023]|nr:hypothetical protein BSKO_00146 [Bryopsis sp. KO-2023]
MVVRRNAQHGDARILEPLAHSSRVEIGSTITDDGIWATPTRVPHFQDIQNRGGIGRQNTVREAHTRNMVDDANQCSEAWRRRTTARCAAKFCSCSPSTRIPSATAEFVSE